MKEIILNALSFNEVLSTGISFLVLYGVYLLITNLYDSITSKRTIEELSETREELYQEMMNKALEEYGLERGYTYYFPENCRPIGILEMEYVHNRHYYPVTDEMNGLQGYLIKPLLT